MSREGIVEHCNWCYAIMPTNYHINKHVREYHPEVDEIELSTDRLRTRYPDVDIEKLISLYVNKNESIKSLIFQGLSIHRHLKLIGVTRSRNSEISVHRTVMTKMKFDTKEQYNAYTYSIVAPKTKEEKLLRSKLIRKGMAKSKFNDLAEPILNTIDEIAEAQEIQKMVSSELAKLKQIELALKAQQENP